MPLLHLASWYATRAVYGRSMESRKLVALDETHFLGEWSAGRALFTRLGRDSRKWNTCVLAASQNPSDVLGMDVANFMSAAFVGRIEDEDAARDGLRMLRVPTGVGYERALANLSAGRGAAGFREFVMRDVDGNVDKIRVDLTANPGLLEALNTTAGRDRDGGRRPSQSSGSHRPSVAGWSDEVPSAGLLRRPGRPSAGDVPAGPASAQVVAFPGSTAPRRRPRTCRVRGSRRSSKRRPTRCPSRRTRSPRVRTTTIYEQYGYAGLRWHTYDLGCGPDAARDPDAVIGTAVSNWMINIPISMSALTASITGRRVPSDVPDVFDPAITKISSALHREPVRDLGAGGHRAAGAGDPAQGASFGAGDHGCSDRVGADGGAVGDRDLPVAVGMRATSPTRPSRARSGPWCRASTAQDRQVDPSVAVASNVAGVDLLQLVAGRNARLRPTPRPRRSTAPRCSRRRR